MLDRPAPRDVHFHHHGPGPGHFGAGPLFGPSFSQGRGRKRRGDVRAAVLLLLSEQPLNGYQLMETIEGRSRGRWRPSPGSIYPALAQLEDQGLIVPVERDGAKLFELTEAGREHLRERGQHAAPWDAGLDPAGENAVDLRALVRQLHLAVRQVAQAGDERQIARAGEALAQTRRRLYRILADDELHEDAAAEEELDSDGPEEDR